MLVPASCAACSSGNMPGPQGAHTCKSGQSNLRTVPACSEPANSADDDGIPSCRYGERSRLSTKKSLPSAGVEIPAANEKSTAVSENQLGPGHDSRRDEGYITTCPACSLGNMSDPEGSHKCKMCKRTVHAFPGCSEATGDEGYGQDRICCICVAKTPTISLSLLTDAGSL